MFRGTIAVHDLTIGHGCVLHLSDVGSSRGTTYFGDVGDYAFDSLIVNAGGEVKMVDGTANTVQMKMTVHHVFCYQIITRKYALIECKYVINWCKVALYTV